MMSPNLDRDSIMIYILNFNLVGIDTTDRRRCSVGNLNPRHSVPELNTDKLP
jgi:hypothetical protein